MNKLMIAFVLAAVLMCCAFPLVALADTSGETGTLDVTYDLSAADVEPTPTTGGGGSNDEESPAASGSYLIVIPSNIGLNYEQDILIRAMSLDIEDNQHITVSIDGAKTFPDGPFYLYNGEDTGDATKRIACNILWGSSSDLSTPPTELLTGPADAVVATFTASGRGAADTYGWLRFFPTYTTNNVAGTYTGTVHFKIAVTNA